MREYQKPVVISRGNVREPISPIAPIAAGVGFLTGVMGDDYRPESMKAIQKNEETMIALFPFLVSPRPLKLPNHSAINM